MAEQNGRPFTDPSSGSSTPLNASGGSSRRNSAGPEPPKVKGSHRVKFSDSTMAHVEDELKELIPDIRVQDFAGSSKNIFPELLDTDISADVTDTPKELRSPAGSDDGEEDETSRKDKLHSAMSAVDRAQRLATLLGSHSAPGSRRNSVESVPMSPTPSQPGSLSGDAYPVRIDDIPLVDMRNSSRRPYSIVDDSTDEDEDAPEKAREQSKEAKAEESQKKLRAAHNAEAHNIVRAMTGRLNLHRVRGPQDGLKSGQITPVEERDDHYAPPPAEYKAGILASLLKLYDHQGTGSPSSGRSPPSYKSHHRTATGDSLAFSTPGSSPPSSGYNTPRGKRPKWYDAKNAHPQSTTSLAGLLSASTMMAAPGSSANVGKPTRPSMPGRTSSGNVVSSAFQKMHRPKTYEDQIRITVHIADVLARQRFIVKLGRALMLYGFPTHRLVDCMRSCARVLQLETQFLYIPGCMIISFDDSTIHTAEVKMVKVKEGIDLGRLKDTHTVYKNVLHDMMGVEEATQNLDEILNAKPKYNKWIIVAAYGFASAFVGPFAFSARLIDLPICFLLGIILGTLQHVIAPASELYSSVFEITATVLTSFLARAFGSIYSSSGTPYFCFSAIAQSSIALILPGYIILCGSLELQSKSLVAGCSRMVYAIIYSLILGFSITVGVALYGSLDSNATSAYECSRWESWWDNNEPLSHFPFVPLFAMCLIIINQGKWTQAPMMIFVAFAGYQVNYWSTKRFASEPQVADALGAFAIGTLGNLYSRLRHGVAAVTIMPSIMVIVPSGLAASGSLLSGIVAADAITGNSTSTASSIITNGTAGFAEAESSNSGSSEVLDLGYGMIQVAIGISVGLFISSLVVYPLGKRRSGLFTF